MSARDKLHPATVGLFLLGVLWRAGPGLAQGSEKTACVQRELSESLLGKGRVSDELTKRYPRMAETIERAVAQLKSTRLGGKPIDTFDTPTRWVGPFPKYALPGPGRLRETIRQVYNRMQDPRALSEYMGQLMRDAADEILRKGIHTELELLQEGQLSRRAVLAVLVQRAEGRGETLSTLTSMKKEDFRNAVRSGPFFEKGFPEGKDIIRLHGLDSHLIQRDYVSDVVARTMNGDVQAFYGYLGSPQGDKMWEVLFDANPSFTNNLCSPAGVMRLIRPFLNTR